MLRRPSEERYPLVLPLSIRLLIFINFLTLLLSFAILGVGIWLARRGYHCSSHLQWLVLSIGIITLAVSFLGFVGARNRVLCLLWLYIAILTLLLLLLLIFTTFAFLLKSHGFQDILNVHASPSIHDLKVSSLLSPGNCPPQSLLSFKHDWGTVAIASLVVLLLLLLVYAIACSAFLHAMNRGAFLHTF